MFPRIPEFLQTLLAIAVLSLGCASGPGVISSTPTNVAVEFPSDDTVGSAGVLAQKECEKHGKLADFKSVDTTASPKTRIALFNCVASSGSESSSNGGEPE